MRSLWVLIVLIDFDQHVVLDKVLVLFVSHRCDALSDQLGKELNVERVRNQLLQTAHLEEG